MMRNDEFYKFSTDHAYEFARVVGIKNKQKGNELQFVYCPYCRGGKSHDKNTFAINLDNGAFNCQRSSCSVKGNMVTLAKDFPEFQLPRDISTYYNIGEKSQYRRFKKMEKPVETKESAICYMKSRGISESVTRKYEVTTAAESDNVLVFPFKNENGDLEFIKYRNTAYKKGDAGSKEWCEKNCKPILFGMNHCTDYGALVMTEGQIDSLSLAEAGVKNAVSVPTGKNGFTWIPHCWNWMVKYEEIVVFGDYENGEVTLSKEIALRFPKKVRIVRAVDYKGCKDANEILQKFGKEALIEAVNNAEVKTSVMIRNLSEVEAKDLTKLPTIKSGYPSLDNAIMGGFHYGELIVLTGKCGQGKSTFASMCIANAVNQGFNCFVYSGELMDFLFKAWIDSQIAGKKTLTNAEINRINEWYNKKIYIYDNSIIEDEISPFEAMKQAVKNLSCKFILIDNLMTAMTGNDNQDLFRLQSDFVKKLAAFAKTYDVVVMLVAHPRKGNGTSNDDISGSGDITNLASVVLRYQKSEDNSAYSKLHITKNRNTGITLIDDNAINMEFHEESRRIIESGQPNFTYMENQPNDFSEVSEYEYIPFE